MRGLLGICLIGWAGLAVADEDEGSDFDAEALAFCLQDAANPAICIGTGSRACWQGDAATITVGLCYAEEFAFWEAARQVLEAELAQQDVRLDDELQELRGGGVADAARGDVIGAWPAYRDARCDYVAARFGPGSGAGPAWTECRMQVTAEHVLWLQKLAREE